MPYAYTSLISKIGVRTSAIESGDGGKQDEKETENERKGGGE